MNIGGSFLGSFPTAGALSRTVLQDITGGHTQVSVMLYLSYSLFLFSLSPSLSLCINQLVGVISSAIVLLVILFVGTLFGSLPNVC